MKKKTINLTLVNESELIPIVYRMKRMGPDLNGFMLPDEKHHCHTWMDADKKQIKNMACWKYAENPSSLDGPTAGESAGL